MTSNLFLSILNNPPTSSPSSTPPTKLSWNEYFLKVAHSVSSRSTCHRANVGCVLTVNNRILSTGYNGAPSSLPSCDEVGHLIHNNHCVRTIHAEHNAILSLLKQYPRPPEGITAYVTHQPCPNCSNLLHTYGIERVFYSKAYGSAPSSPHYVHLP